MSSEELGLHLMHAGADRAQQLCEDLAALPGVESLEVIVYLRFSVSAFATSIVQQALKKQNTLGTRLSTCATTGYPTSTKVRRLPCPLAEGERGAVHRAHLPPGPPQEWRHRRRLCLDLYLAKAAPQNAGLPTFSK